MTRALIKIRSSINKLLCSHYLLYNLHFKQAWSKHMHNIHLIETTGKHASGIPCRYSVLHFTLKAFSISHHTCTCKSILVVETYSLILIKKFQLTLLNLDYNISKRQDSWYICFVTGFNVWEFCELRFRWNQFMYPNVKQFSHTSLCIVQKMKTFNDIVQCTWWYQSNRHYLFQSNHIIL